MMKKASSDGDSTNKNNHESEKIQGGVGRGRGKQQPPSLYRRQQPPWELGDEKEGSSSKNPPPPSSSDSFHLKLYSVLNSASTSDKLWDIVSWSPDGVSFKVHDKDRFETEVLPTYFGTSSSLPHKFRAFKKNLKLWGFKKITTKDQWSHPCFQRDYPALRHSMKKPPATGKSSSSSSVAAPARRGIPPSPVQDDDDSDDSDDKGADSSSMRMPEDSATASAIHESNHREDRRLLFGGPGGAGSQDEFAFSRISRALRQEAPRPHQRTPQAPNTTQPPSSPLTNEIENLLKDYIQNDIALQNAVPSHPRPPHESILGSPPPPSQVPGGLNQLLMSLLSSLSSNSRPTTAAAASSSTTNSSGHPHQHTATTATNDALAAAVSSILAARRQTPTTSPAFNALLGAVGAAGSLQQELASNLFLQTLLANASSSSAAPTSSHETVLPPSVDSQSLQRHRQDQERQQVSISSLSQRQDKDLWQVFIRLSGAAVELLNRSRHPPNNRGQEQQELEWTPEMTVLAMLGRQQQQQEQNKPPPLVLTPPRNTMDHFRRLVLLQDHLPHHWWETPGTGATSEQTRRRAAAARDAIGFLPGIVGGGDSRRIGVAAAANLVARSSFPSVSSLLRAAPAARLSLDRRQQLPPPSGAGIGSILNSSNSTNSMQKLTAQAIDLLARKKNAEDAHSTLRIAPEEWTKEMKALAFLGRLLSSQLPTPTIPRHQQSGRKRPPPTP